MNQPLVQAVVRDLFSDVDELPRSPAKTGGIAFKPKKPPPVETLDLFETEEEPPPPVKTVQIKPSGPPPSPPESPAPEPEPPPEEVTLPEPPPVETRYRTDDPETSKQAARLMHGYINQRQKAVLSYFQKIYPDATTDVELNEYFGDIKSTWRSRRGELTDAGLIAATGEKRKINGTNHKLWIVTDKGRTVDCL